MISHSRRCAKTLRHECEKLGLEVEGDGFVVMEGVSLDQLKQVVKINDKKWFGVMEDEHK